MFSYPTFDVEIERKVVPESLSWPAPGTAADDCSLGGNRSYVDLRQLPWSEAKRVYALEEELVTRIESAYDPEEEYALIEDELYEDPEGLYGLDIGVASTVVALSAARCVPFSSCNGGAYGGSHHEWHPVVAFYSCAKMAGLMLGLAEASGVGLCNEEGGRLIVYASDVRHMRAFAKTLIESRSAFRALRSPRGETPLQPIRPRRIN